MAPSTVASKKKLQLTPHAEQLYTQLKQQFQSPQAKGAQIGQLLLKLKLSSPLKL